MALTLFVARNSSCEFSIDSRDPMTRSVLGGEGGVPFLRERMPNPHNMQAIICAFPPNETHCAEHLLIV